MVGNILCFTNSLIVANLAQITSEIKCFGLGDVLLGLKHSKNGGIICIFLIPLLWVDTHTGTHIDNC